MVEKYMKNKFIDFIALNETHIATTHRENRKGLTWYFNGTKTGTETTLKGGAALVIKNELETILMYKV